MAQFNIDIPGLGTVAVDGNFATEDSINRLTSMLKSGGKGFNPKNLQDGANAIADSLHDMDPALQRSKKEFDKTNKSVNQFNAGFSKTNGLFSDLSDPGSGTLTKFVKSVGEAGSGIVNLIPGIGSALSGALGAITGLLTEAISFAQGLIDTNKDIHTTGIALQGGLKSLQLAAEDANIPFNQFAKSMIENSESLRLMAGGAPGGVMAVSKSMGLLTKNMKPTYENLLAMGYTVEDIMGAMTDFGVNANMVGRSLSVRELAEGTADYLKSQQELNRLTGMDIKQAKEKAREQDKSLFVQKQLNQIQDPEARKRAAALLAVSEKMGIDDFVASGASMTQTSGLIVANAQQTSDALRNLYLNIDNLSAEEFNNRLAEIMSSPQLEADLKSIVNTFGNVKSELYKNVPIEAIENFRFEALRMIGAAKLGGDFYDNYTKNLSETDKAIVTTEKTLTSLNSALSGLGFMMFNFIDSYLGTGGDFVNEGIQGFQKLTGSIDKLQTANEQLALLDKTKNKEEYDAKMKQIESIQKEINGMFGSDSSGSPVTALFEKLKETMTNFITNMGTKLSGVMSAFTDEFMYKFDNLLGAILPGYTSAYENVQSIYEEAKKMQLNQKVSGEPIYEESLSVDPMGGIGGTSQVQTNTAETDLYQKLKSLSPAELQALGFAKDGNGFKRIELPGNVDIESIVKAQKNKQALGGIFNYKPGGELVTVAEAGPEVVAPAKRTKEGKLGLEVSGAQLDNSQLLRSLVDINKGQADLMASLNTKIEKLVSEQRQANRLSV